MTKALMNKALMSIFTGQWLFSASGFEQVRELLSPDGRGCGQPNLPVIENLIEQIRGTNLESGAKEKVERLLRAVVRIENSILAMKIPFSDDAAPISSSN